MMLLLLGPVFAVSLAGQQESDVAGEIIAMERAMLERWCNGDPWGFIEISAPEISYHDPALQRRIDGFEAFRDYLAPIEGTIYADSFELLNPRVQVHGDVAVLSFNFVSYSASEGTTRESRWNSTEVYSRIDGEWKLIHSHWSHTQPFAQQEELEEAP